MAEVATQVTDKTGLLSKDTGMNLYIANFRPDFQAKVGLPLAQPIIKLDKLDDNKENEANGEYVNLNFTKVSYPDWKMSDYTVTAKKPLGKLWLDLYWTRCSYGNHSQQTKALIGTEFIYYSTFLCLEVLQ
ncbi:hypothetical protein FSP39_007299 [Pinctada imbricata]|uniref:Uncharacterized protein n=1 Tax=Pinctada imbricata TaxID=66713 RepID=A0AA88XPL2_PINIB|nr:hypothetical protein FSP39_007299 [Pinctada imbricata]